MLVCSTHFGQHQRVGVLITQSVAAVRILRNNELCGMIHGVENTTTIFIVFVGIDRCFGITASEIGIRRYLQSFEGFKVCVYTDFFDVGFIVWNNTVLIVITQRHQTSCFFVTTAYGKAVILLQGRAVNCILPLVGFTVCDSGKHNSVAAYK